jgi:hypothetical protein
MTKPLTASLNCVHGIPGRVLLPTTNPVRRARLRKMALENVVISAANIFNLSRHIDKNRLFG